MGTNNDANKRFIYNVLYSANSRAFLNLSVSPFSVFLSVSVFECMCLSLWLTVCFYYPCHYVCLSLFMSSILTVSLRLSSYLVIYVYLCVSISVIPSFSVSLSLSVSHCLLLSLPLSVYLSHSLSISLTMYIQVYVAYLLFDLSQSPPLCIPSSPPIHCPSLPCHHSRLAVIRTIPTNSPQSSWLITHTLHTDHFAPRPPLHNRWPLWRPQQQRPWSLSR